jgi:hypothetical protein
MANQDEILSLRHSFLPRQVGRDFFLRVLQVECVPAYWQLPVKPFPEPSMRLNHLPLEIELPVVIRSCSTFAGPDVAGSKFLADCRAIYVHLFVEAF